MCNASFRVAASGLGGTFHLEMNGVNVTGPLTVPDTGGWQNWQTVSATIPLVAEPQIARLVMDTNGSAAVGNFDYVQFVAVTPGGRWRGCSSPVDASPQVANNLDAGRGGHADAAD